LIVKVSNTALNWYIGSSAYQQECDVRRPSPAKTRLAATQIGEHVVTWRKLQGLTAEQVAQRAGISRPTLRKVESGDPTVTMETFLNVLRALGRLESVAKALDPYETDLGRARADQMLPGRVRR
jgi:DNA-binding XRE family transcriptional regulator